MVVNFQDLHSERDDTSNSKEENVTMCTKLSFISVSIAVILLFIVKSMAVTVRLAVGEFLCNKPSLNSLPSNSTSDVYFDRLSDILVIPVGFLHIPEHIFLLCYLYKFLKSFKNWNRLYKKAIRIKMKDFVSSKWGRAFFYVLIVTVFMVIGIGLPPICIVRLYAEKDSSIEHCSRELDMITRALTHIFHFSSLFTNIVIVLVRLLMITFTIMVGVMWREVKPEADPTNEEQEIGNQHCPLSNAFAKVCKKHTKHMLEYTLITKKVGVVYRIFRSFFVLQWIIHLFGLFCHIAHLLRPWIRYGQVQNVNMLIVTQQIDQFCYVIFNGLALVITHVCGLKMNAYMRRYVRDIQFIRFKDLEPLNDFQATRANSDNQRMYNLEYSLTHLISIKQESLCKSAFTPRIPGTGLSISITNPGFVVSIVLSIFALIGAMIAF